MPVDIRFDNQNSNQPVVVFVHGFKGFKDWGHFPMVGDELVKAGFAFVSFNFTHDGTTVEKPADFADLDAFSENNYHKELFDTDAVLTALSNGSLFPEVDVNRSKLLLLGHSRGGGVSIVKAAESELVSGLVTWNSIGDMKRTNADIDDWKRDGVTYVPNARTNQQMPLKYQFVEDVYAQEERYNLELACAKISVPAMYIHGTNDQVVPFNYAEKLHSWTKNSSLVAIEEGNHTFGGKHPFSESDLPNDSKLALNATIEHFRKIG